MRYTTKKKIRILALLLTFVLLISACSSGASAPTDLTQEAFPITVDDTGLASWEPVEGAIHYEYCIVDAT